MTSDKVVSDLKRLIADVRSEEDPASLAAGIARAIGQYMLEHSGGPGIRSSNFHQINGGILWGIHLAYIKLLEEADPADQAAVLGDLVKQTGNMATYVFNDLRKK